MPRKAGFWMCLALSFIALSAPVAAEVQSPSPSWAADRVDQRSLPLNASYGYTTTGQGVQVHILDSGINRAHTDFAGRTVIIHDWENPTWGNGSDLTNHGTPVASIAAGNIYGVAKGAEIHVHRVIGYPASDNDASALAEEFDRFTKALYWILWNHRKPAVVNISYNREFEQAGSLAGSCENIHNFDLDIHCAKFRDAIIALVQSGVPVVVSAGNRGWGVGSYCAMGCNGSTCGDWQASCACCEFEPLYNLPAMAHQNLIVVGATTISNQAGMAIDRRVSFTHYDVDIYAPGWYILAASTGSTTATTYFSYTSAAAPAVTGVVARYLQAHPTATPAQIKTWLTTTATFGSIANVPYFDQHMIYMSPAE